MSAGGVRVKAAALCLVCAAVALDCACGVRYSPGMPSLVTSFWISFSVTLVLLIATIASGLRRRRVAHLVFALLAVGLLTLTIVLAERVGAARTFPPGPMRIHLWFAQSAACMVLPVVVTGVVLWRRPGFRWAHRVAVLVFLLLTVSASATGTWVFGMSEAK